jgi:transposase
VGGGDRCPGQSIHALAPLCAPAAHAQKKTFIAREQDAAERAAYRAEIAQLEPTTLIFLDETSTSLRLTPVRGRAPRGERLVDRVPRGKWESVTYLASFSLNGIGPSVLLPGALDRAALEIFVAEQLVPHLRPGQTVVWDNLSVHKSAGAKTLIETAAAHLRFLPRYSPDYNPIEQAFSKLKTHLRRRRPRSFDELVAATAEAIDRITPHDALGFFIAAGIPAKRHIL